MAYFPGCGLGEATIPRLSLCKMLGKQTKNPLGLLRAGEGGLGMRTPQHGARRVWHAACQDHRFCDSPTDDEPYETRDQRVDGAQILQFDGRAGHGAAFGRISNSSGWSMEMIDQPSARCSGLQS